MIDIRTLRASHRALHLLKKRSTVTQKDLIRSMPEDPTDDDRNEVLHRIEADE